ncbi:MAG TPA: alpha-amylase family glycosyl hydrolase, partial [Bryobacteraceae bacterium]
MHSFKVWAPKAENIAVKVGEHMEPMRREEGGWWTAKVEKAGPGSDYLFVINGAPVPDPRSAWQPNGINGPSRVVDHSAFQWTDASWQARPLSSAIIYELHIGTFTPAGTFKSTIEKLDYLVDLGITHVELMPVNEFSGDWGWGYDGVDLYAPHHTYGTPDDLKQLVNACHEKGLAVLLDVVYNHFGPVGNYLSQFGPYFTDAYHTPWGQAVNLDHAGSVEVRRFFADNALMWLRDYHFDGLRLDAIHAY